MTQLENVFLPNGEAVQTFKPYPGVLLKNITVDSHVAKYFPTEYIIHTGKYKQSEHGEYEVIKIKPGAKCLIMFNPNNSLYLVAPNSRTTFSTKAKLNENVAFDFENN